MKRVFVTILTLIYVLITSGFTIHHHYCMGKLANWGLGQNMSAVCGKCGMDKIEADDSNCCHDEYKFIKLEQVQKVPESSPQLKQILAITGKVSFFEVILYHSHFQKKKEPFSHGPPQNYSVPSYIRNCVFLI